MLSAYIKKCPVHNLITCPSHYLCGHSKNKNSRTTKISKGIKKNTSAKNKHKNIKQEKKPTLFSTQITNLINIPSNAIITILSQKQSIEEQTRLKIDSLAEIIVKVKENIPFAYTIKYGIYRDDMQLSKIKLKRGFNNSGDIVLASLREVPYITWVDEPDTGIYNYSVKIKITGINILQIYTKMKSLNITQFINN